MFRVCIQYCFPKLYIYSDCYVHLICLHILYTTFTYMFSKTVTLDSVRCMINTVYSPVYSHNNTVSYSYHLCCEKEVTKIYSYITLVLLMSACMPLQLMVLIMYSVNQHGCSQDYLKGDSKFSSWILAQHA